MRNSLKLLIIVLIFIANCTIKLPDDPKAPIWDVVINRLPLFKADTLSVGEQLKPEDFERVGADSILFVKVSDSTSFNLEDKLTIPGQSRRFADKLGDFEVDINYSVEEVITFTDLFPQYSGLVGQKTVIPATNITPISRDITINEFISLSIVTGRINLEIDNFLGVPLGDDVKVDLLDKGNGNILIKTINMERIPHGESRTFPIDLEGRVLSAQFSVRIYGDMVGSEGSEVDILQTSGFAVQLSPDFIRAESALAKLPPQTLSADLSGEIDINSDTIRVDYAIIKSGYIHFSTNNESELPLRIELTIPNLLVNGDTEFTRDFEVNPKYMHDYTIDLDQLKLDMVENEKLQFETKVEIITEPDKFYSLKSSDSLKVEVTVSDIEVKSVTADFDVHTSFPEIKETIFEDPPEELDNIDFNDVIFNLSFPEADFNLELDIEIVAYRDGEMKTLAINHIVEKGESLILSKDGINYNGESPTIKDILNMIPETIVVRGIVGIQGDDVTVNRNDEFSIVYRIDVPLSFALRNSSYTDIDSLTIDDDVRDDMKEYLLDANLDVTLENRIPVSGLLKTFIGPDSLNTDTELFTIELPQPNLKNGIVNEAGVSIVTFSLTQEKINILSQSKYYRYNLILRDSNLSTITSNDELIVKNVYISGKFKVDPEGISEED